MRTILAALPFLALLAGCGQSDEAARNEIRDGALRSCLEGVQGAAAPPGVSWDILCRCVTDKVIEGKTPEQLELPPSDTERRNAVRSCIIEARQARAAR